MTETRDVIAIKRFEGGPAVLEDGSTIPIIMWFDEHGESTEPANATQCIAGAEDLGWWVIDLDMFTGKPS